MLPRKDVDQKGEIRTSVREFSLQWSQKVSGGGDPTGRGELDLARGHASPTSLLQQEEETFSAFPATAPLMESHYTSNSQSPPMAF